MATISRDPALLVPLKSKTAIITGGANGIGAETVRLLHSKGANVVIADLPQSKSAAATLITSLSDRVIFMPTDILNWASMVALFKVAKDKFGHVDIVVANAGMMESRKFYDWEDIDENGDLKEPKEAYRIVDVNLKGTMNTLRLALHNMKGNAPSSSSGSCGSIILVSSTSGYFGGTAVVSYVSSKHGVMGLLRSSQQVANASNIRVNAVAPFFTPTHITSSFAQSWADAGLPANTTEDVAWAIAQTAMTVEFKGRCCLVAGKVMKEVEGPREQLIGTWFGEDVADLMAKGGKLFDDLGGYPLPRARSEV